MEKMDKARHPPLVWPTRLFVGPVLFPLQLTGHSRVKAGRGIVKVKLTVRYFLLHSLNMTAQDFPDLIKRRAVNNVFADLSRTAQPGKITTGMVLNAKKQAFRVQMLLSKFQIA